MVEGRLTFYELFMYEVCIAVFHATHTEEYLLSWMYIQMSVYKTKKSSDW